MRRRRQSGNGQSAAVPPTVFVAELTYAGVFTLSGLPDNAVEPVLLVECPRILFPFARNILSDVTRDGGFPPVLLQPIDFVALWQARRAQAAGSGRHDAQSPDPVSGPQPNGILELRDEGRMRGQLILAWHDRPRRPIVRVCVDH